MDGTNDVSMLISACCLVVSCGCLVYVCMISLKRYKKLNSYLKQRNLVLMHRIFLEILPSSHTVPVNDLPKIFNEIVSRAKSFLDTGDIDYVTFGKSKDGKAIEVTDFYNLYLEDKISDKEIMSIVDTANFGMKYKKFSNPFGLDKNIIIKETEKELTKEEDKAKSE